MIKMKIKKIIVNLSGNNALNIFRFAYKNTFVTLFSKNGRLKIVEFTSEGDEIDSLSDWLNFNVVVFIILILVEVMFLNGWWGSNQ